MGSEMCIRDRHISMRVLLAVQYATAQSFVQSSLTSTTSRFGLAIIAALHSFSFRVSGTRWQFLGRLAAFPPYLCGSVIRHTNSDLIVFILSFRLTAASSARFMFSWINLTDSPIVEDKE